jgi:DNA polymerase-3 subunit alpha
MNRPSLLASIPIVLKHLSDGRKHAGQVGLFAAPTVEDLPLADLPDWPDDTRLWHERRVLGAFVSGHPVIPRREARADSFTHRCRDSFDMERSVGARIVVAGLVRRYEQRPRIAFLTLEDETGAFDCIAFSDEFERFAHCLMVNAILAVQLKPRFDNDRRSLQLVNAFRLGHLRNPEK